MGALAEYSPHLLGKLERRLYDRSLAPFEDALQFAISHGGLDEIDFKREPGVSYNPRPARVALILMDDLRVLEEEVLQAGICASIEATEFPITAALPKSLPAQVFRIAADAKCSFSELGVQDGNEVLQVALALLLDRLRHLHLAPLPRLREVWPALESEVELAHRRAIDIESPIVSLLEHWQTRSLPKLREKINA